MTWQEHQYSMYNLFSKIWCGNLSRIYVKETTALARSKGGKNGFGEITQKMEFKNLGSENSKNSPLGDYK